MRKIHAAVLLLLISILAFPSHNPPAKKVSWPFAVSINGPETVYAGEKPAYRICIENISDSPIIEDEWEGAIFSPSAIPTKYDADDFRFPYPLYEFFSDPLATFWSYTRIGSLEPGENTCLTLQLINSFSERSLFERMNHWESVGIDLFSQATYEFLKVKKPVYFIVEQPSINIIQNIIGPDRVVRNSNATYTFTIQNGSPTDFSTTSSNAARWELLIPASLEDIEIIASSAGPATTISEEVNARFSRSFTRYTFSLQDFSSDTKYEVTIELMIPDMMDPNNSEMLPLLSQFINENSSLDDEIPFLHTYQAFSPIIIPIGTFQ